MKLNEMMRYCAIKKNGNFRLIDTCYMTESERIFLLTSLLDDKIQKHFFNYSNSLLLCNQIQTDIEDCKTCLRFATIEEKQKFKNELDDLQVLLNYSILNLRK